MRLLTHLRQRRTGYSAKVLSTQRSSLLGYWPLYETSGTAIIDLSGIAGPGTYIGSVSLGQPGISSSGLAIVLDGSTTYGQIGTLAFRTAFNGPAGTVLAWARVSGAGVWSDATDRRVVTIRVDASNLALIRRSSTNNTLNLQYVAGGTTKNVSVTTSSTDWMHLGVTWDKAADQVKVYFNGAQTGSTLTGLGVWAGVPGTSTTLLGATGTAPTGVWSGSLAHLAVWSVALSAAAIAKLAVAV